MPPSIYDELEEVTVQLLLLVPLVLTGASLSPEEALIPPSLPPPDDHSQYHDVLQLVAAVLNILNLEKVQAPQNQLLDVLQLPGPS